MMNSQWRAVQSFQENQNFISAINTLSIHIKLEMAGHSDLNRAEAVPKAKKELCDFLTELDSQVKCIEVEKKPLLGVDPRRRKFVKHLIAAKNEYRIHHFFRKNFQLFNNFYILMQKRISKRFCCYWKSSGC